MNFDASSMSITAIFTTPKLGDYVAARYDEKWYVSVILDTGVTNGDTFCKLHAVSGAINFM